MGYLHAIDLYQFDGIGIATMHHLQKRCPSPSMAVITNLKSGIMDGPVIKSGCYCPLVGRNTSDFAGVGRATT